MLPQSYTLNSIVDLVIFIWSKIIHISLVHFTSGIHSDVYNSFSVISHLWRISILNWYASQTQKVAKYAAKQIRAIVGGILWVINYLPEWHLCHPFLYLTWLRWSTFRVISMPGCFILQLVLFKKISAVHLTRVQWFSLCWSTVTWMVPKMPPRYTIPQLEQCCPCSWIITLLHLEWNDIVLMNLKDKVIIIWQPALGIIQN